MWNLLAEETVDKAATSLIDVGATGAMLVIVLFVFAAPILWWILRNFRKVNDDQRADYTLWKANYDYEKAKTAKRNAEIFGKFMAENTRINDQRARIAEDATRAITTVMTKIDSYIDTQNKLLEKFNDRS